MVNITDRIRLRSEDLNENRTHLKVQKTHASATINRRNNFAQQMVSINYLRTIREKEEAKDNAYKYYMQESNKLITDFKNKIKELENSNTQNFLYKHIKKTTFDSIQKYFFNDQDLKTNLETLNDAYKLIEQLRNSINFNYTRLISSLNNYYEGKTR